jgi:hypothetical protein
MYIHGCNGNIQSVLFIAGLLAVERTTSLRIATDNAARTAVVSPAIKMFRSL